MLNFNFYNPTHIVFGKDTLDQLNSLVPADAKVLITYGGGSVNKFGTLDKVIQNLPGREIFQFGGIEPNPQYSTLMKAVQIAKDENVDFLLAVGGGSVMDGTKFIALASRYEGDCLDLLTPEFDLAPVDSAIPMGTVVTLPATGSEMNNGAVISHKNLKVPVFSMFTFPKFSILDPTLTFTLPTTQVANGIIDTFIHTVEQYVTYPVDARFQDRTAEGILKTLIEIGKTTIDEPTNYDARANLVWCATMALNGLIGAGVPQDWTTHMIGHEVTAMFGIDHAKTLAILQPAIWEIRKDKKRAKLIQYAERVWDITEADENLKIELAIQKTRAFFEDLGVKTHLSDYDITAERIEDLIEALNNNNRTALSETGDLTLEISREILKKAL
ncbi:MULTISPECIES: iron-containing alcohol dehydrogenase [unclassified Cetobacterium]|uniref:iron-containing alcohol dehydrogenase n=1 Tax=unclassified Cetobacterium TaxID=2630983 RepID=UPI000645669F|nr:MULTISPECIES: iron-containing alcohol dehydrogenase [unclassified Cetobacterium]